LPYILNEWLNLAVRWFHVFAGIMWIGQTYFFTWLDHTLNREGNVWMVHSGGFYVVDKQSTPQLLPKTLHWFKWEAMLTWLSGIFLLTFVYYHGRIMVDETSKLTNIQAVGVSIAIMVVGWLVYDLLWISPLAKHEVAGAVVSYLLLVAAIYGFTRIFAGRAAYMQTGALLGTLMAWNVWARILPAQRQLIAAVKDGRAPNMRLAEIAKKRSKQNTFMVVPVVFIMISNHFPVATYGNHLNWIVLAGLILAGWIAAAIIRTR
jgi:uncharacterized membrane protein